MLSDLNKNNGVLYIGASVTAQKEGYRPILHKMLCEWRKEEIPMFVDALGGIGSLYGLANFQRFKETYRGKVGLIIFEFSTGDLNISTSTLKILDELITAFTLSMQDICANIVFVHNYRSDFPGEKGEVVRSVYNAVAAKANIPVLKIYQDVEEEVLKDSTWFTAHFRDIVHTFGPGSEFVAKRIFKRLIELAPSPSLTGILPSGKLSQLTSVYLSDTLGKEPADTLVYANTQHKFPFLEIKDGEKLNLIVSGEIYGIMNIMGPQSCYININANNNDVVVRAFDRHCHYNRPHCMPMRLSLAAGTKLTISASPEKMDFSIVSKEHPDLLKPRVLKIIGFIGCDLKISEA